MENPLKSILLLLALIIVFFSLPFPTLSFDELEARLQGSSGKERLEILTALAVDFRDKDPRKSLQYGNQALELIKKIPVDDVRINPVALRNALSRASILLGEFEKGRGHAEQARQSAKANRDQSGLAYALYNIGDSHRRQGNYKEAKSFLNQALEIYKENNDARGLGDSYDSIGLVYWKQGDLETALKNILESAKYQEKAGNTFGLAEAYNHTGIMYWELENLNRALTYYLKAGELYEKIGDKLGQGKVLNNTAMIYDKQGKHEMAMANFLASLALDKEVGSKSAISVTLYFLARHYEQRGMLEEARENFSRSLEIARQLRDTEHTAGNLVALSRVEYRLGLRKQALDHVREGLDLALEIKAQEWVSHGYQQLSTIYEDLGEYKDALEFHKRYHVVDHSIFSETSSRKMTEMEARYEADKKENQIKLQQLDIKRQKNQKKWLLLVSVLVLILLAVLYARFRLKNRVTKALRAEIQQRKAAEADLLKSQKLEAVGILAGGIAHDFNNLLAIIIGNLGMALENENLGPDIVKMLNSAEKSSMQAAELSEKLVTFSKGGWIYPQDTSLRKILYDTLGRFPELQVLNLKINIPREMPDICADERQIRQVFHNLLLNAIEAIGPKGNVVFDAKYKELDKDNDFALDPGGYAFISISDDGKGITPELMDKIFDPYFSTKDDVTRKGMGLGLAICYSIIRKHNGHIYIRSEPGSGTTVNLYLPTAQ